MALNPQLYIDAVVKKYGIHLRGSGQAVQIKFNSNLHALGISRKATPNMIEVGPQAFADEATLANTLVHELNHARSWLKGGKAPEFTAYLAGDALEESIKGKR